ncbi:MAG: type II toxin-antitoxin system RelE/ParE family toxin, partial [Betaproteobacteria bacterium]
RALDDLSEIWIFIADDSVAQADSFIDSIDAQLRTLATQPLMGRARDELAPNLRSMPIGRYVIFYEALPDGIVIARVLHSARDVEAQFESE